MTPDDSRNSLGKGPWGQKTHFTAKLIAITQLTLLGCVSQWQGGTSPRKSLSLSKTQRRWQFLVAGHHREQGLVCLSTMGVWPESGQGEETTGKEKISSCLEFGSMHTTQTLAETPSSCWLLCCQGATGWLQSVCLGLVWSQVQSRCLARGRSSA